MAFPATYDALSNPTAGSLLTSPSHAGQHSTANDTLEAIEQRVGLSGSGFPGSPSSGQFFWHTTRNLEYFYNGTRWLSTNLYTVTIPPTRTLLPGVATMTMDQMVPWAAVYDLWLEHFQASFYVDAGTALGASHKWVVTLVKQPAASTIATINIDSGSSSVYRTSSQVSIAALVGTTNYAVNAIATKTGTPGGLYLFPIITYRLVG